MSWAFRTKHFFSQADVKYLPTKKHLYNRTILKSTVMFSIHTVPKLKTSCNANHSKATHPLDYRLFFDPSISLFYDSFSFQSLSFSLCSFLNISFFLASSHPQNPCGAGDISESGDQTHSYTHTHILITEQQLESKAVLILFLPVNGIISFN